jgi:hypothetical protein
MSRMWAGAFLVVVVSAGVLAVTALSGCTGAPAQPVVASASASARARTPPVKPTVNADGRCTAAQLTMIGQPRQIPQLSTLYSGLWVVEEIYRNSGASCTLAVSREVTLTSVTGTSATTLMPATPHRYLRHGKRVYMDLRVEWIPAVPRAHIRGCRTAAREVASVTVLAGSLKLTFPLHPAQPGVCRSQGVLLSTSSKA